MNESGYATGSIDEAEPSVSDEIERIPFTDSLGCTDMSVDGYRLPPDIVLTLPARPEQLCIPIDTEDEPISIDGSTPIPRPGVGRIPAGVECSLQNGPRAEATVFVVSASAEPTTETAPTTVDLAECEFAVPSTSDIATARLTAPLGCAGMKVNARILEAGQWVPYHTEGDQEELFVPVDGPATMRIADDSYETPVGTVTRVAPEVPRTAVNDGETDTLWVMVGAPPTGGPSEWDPGAEILE